MITKQNKPPLPLWILFTALGLSTSVHASAEMACLTAAAGSSPKLIGVTLQQSEKADQLQNERTRERLLQSVTQLEKLEAIEAELKATWVGYDEEINRLMGISRKLLNRHQALLQAASNGEAVSARGKPFIVHLHGFPGYGKTSLPKHWIELMGMQSAFHPHTMKDGQSRIPTSSLLRLGTTDGDVPDKPMEVIALDEVHKIVSKSDVRQAIQAMQNEINVANGRDAVELEQEESAPGTLTAEQILVAHRSDITPSSLNQAQKITYLQEALSSRTQANHLWWQVLGNGQASLSGTDHPSHLVENLHAAHAEALKHIESIKAQKAEEEKRQKEQLQNSGQEQSSEDGDSATGLDKVVQEQKPKKVTLSADTKVINAIKKLCRSHSPIYWDLLKFALGENISGEPLIEVEEMLEAPSIEKRQVSDSLIEKVAALWPDHRSAMRALVDQAAASIPATITKTYGNLVVLLMSNPPITQKIKEQVDESAVTPDILHRLSSRVGAADIIAGWIRTFAGDFANIDPWLGRWGYTQDLDLIEAWDSSRWKVYVERQLTFASDEFQTNLRNVGIEGALLFDPSIAKMLYDSVVDPLNGPRAANNGVAEILGNAMGQLEAEIQKMHMRGGDFSPEDLLQFKMSFTGTDGTQQNDLLIESLGAGGRPNGAFQLEAQRGRISEPVAQQNIDVYKAKKRQWRHQAAHFVAGVQVFGSLPARFSSLVLRDGSDIRSKWWRSPDREDLEYNLKEATTMIASAVAETLPPFSTFVRANNNSSQLSDGFHDIENADAILLNTLEDLKSRIQILRQVQDISSLNVKELAPTLSEDPVVLALFAAAKENPDQPASKSEIDEARKILFDRAKELLSEGEPLFLALYEHFGSLDTTQLAFDLEHETLSQLIADHLGHRRAQTILNSDPGNPNLSDSPEIYRMPRREPGRFGRWMRWLKDRLPFLRGNR